MKRIKPSIIDGHIHAPSSKSIMQRAIAISTLSKCSKILNPSFCDDSQSAINIAKSLGSDIQIRNNALYIKSNQFPPNNLINCGESGLCMRMFAPILSLQKTPFTLISKGSLCQRPISIGNALTSLGVQCKSNNEILTIQGPINAGKITIDGSITSQLLTGLLMALPLCNGDSTIQVTNLASKPYIIMTIALLRHLGIIIDSTKNLNLFHIQGNQQYTPFTYYVEGDWSAASFFLVAGAIGGKIHINGISTHSLQADKAILDVLKMVGANIIISKDSIFIEKRKLNMFEFDATQCPDLIPPLVALACSCHGTSTLKGAKRLIYKESNRAKALLSEFTKLNGKIILKDDIIQVTGSRLHGATIESHNDHRIAMAISIAAINAKSDVIVNNHKCVSKSYPNFFKDLESVSHNE